MIMREWALPRSLLHWRLVPAKACLAGGAARTELKKYRSSSPADTSIGGRWRAWSALNVAGATQTAKAALPRTVENADGLAPALVHSSAQVLNVLRKPWGRALWPARFMSAVIAMSDRGLPLYAANKWPDRPETSLSASGTSGILRLSFVLVRLAAKLQTSPSISSPTARRTSLVRASVSMRKRNARDAVVSSAQSQR